MNQATTNSKERKAKYNKKLNKVDKETNQESEDHQWDGSDLSRFVNFLKYKFIGDRNKDYLVGRDKLLSRKPGGIISRLRDAEGDILANIPKPQKKEKVEQ